MYTQNHGKNAEPDAGIPVPPPDYGGNLAFSAAANGESGRKAPEETEKEKPQEKTEKAVSVLPRFWDNVTADDLLLLGAVLFLLFSGQSESLLMPLVLIAAILL